MPRLYWDTIELGDPVAPLSKPAVTRVQIAKFAGAAQDWSPLHIDDDFAKSAGYGSVFAHGATSMGFAVEAVQKWLENGRALTSTATFQKLVWPGDILTAKGVVVNRYEHNGEARIDVDVWAENQNHDIVMKGQITCLLWRNDKEEKKSKTPWPQVAPETIAERRTAKPVPKNESDAQKARLEAAAAQQAQQAHAVELKKVPRAAKPAPPPPPPPAKPVAAKAPPVAVKPVAAKPAAKAAPPAKAPAKPAKPVKAPAKPAAKAPAKPAPKAPAKPAPKAPAKPAKPAPVAKKPAPKAPAKPAKKAPAKPAKKK
jgi:acyl dehydratase